MLRRLLKQSYEAIEREKQLKESEQLYLKLKEVLAHQPGPTIREDLNRALMSNKSKEEKLKVRPLFFALLKIVIILILLLTLSINDYF